VVELVSEDVYVVVVLVVVLVETLVEVVRFVGFPPAGDEAVPVAAVLEAATTNKKAIMRA
jgi:hypothetical protein